MNREPQQLEVIVESRNLGGAAVNDPLISELIPMKRADGFQTAAWR
ncbi:hypothetical protein [Mesorhizobium sp.]|nr:hypothetical protein [Mesorhizobium sp.]